MHAEDIYFEQFRKWAFSFPPPWIYPYVDGWSKQLPNHEAYKIEKNKTQQQCLKYPLA